MTSCLCCSKSYVLAMPDLPDYSRSRAILIGTASYQDPGFLPLPAAANSLAGMRQVLTDPDLCGWPAEQVTVLADPSDVRRLVQTLRRLARNTDEVLLVYFVGHGVIMRRGHLCLALADTDAEDPDITGLEYQRVREALRDSPARVKVAILDCCYSGRAIEALSTATDITNITDTQGVYTLTASDQTAHVPPLDQQANTTTSFTGELLDLIRSGIPGGPERLTLGTLYLHLRRRLHVRDLPSPNQSGTDTVAQFPFTRNAIPPPVLPKPVAPPSPLAVSPPSHGHDQAVEQPDKQMKDAPSDTREAAAGPAFIPDSASGTRPIENPATTELTWLEFRRRLARALASLDPETFLIVEDGNYSTGRYVQAIREQDRLHVEAVSNRYLNEPFLLTPADEATLAEAGWAAGDDQTSENWSTELSLDAEGATTIAEFDVIANMMITALRDAQGIQRPSQLVYQLFHKESTDPLEIVDFGIALADQSRRPAATEVHPIPLLQQRAPLPPAAPGQPPAERQPLLGDGVFATLKTTMGRVVVRLFPEQAPETVSNFTGLAEGTRAWTDPRSGRPSNDRLYDGTVFHRVIEGFMIQGGDPLGTGTGGPGFKFRDEFHSGLRFDRPYLLAMANAGPGTNGSQFFITVSPAPHLNERHTIFGEVIAGKEVVDAIARTPTDNRDRPLTDIVIESVTMRLSRPN